MANKRRLKKQIRYICGDVAAECITSIYLIPNVDKAKMRETVGDTAALQTHALLQSNVSFDKTPRDYPSLKEYNAARKAYFKKAYGALVAQFNKKLGEIVKEMNQALPKK